MTLVLLAGLPLANIGCSRTNENRVFRHHRRPLVTEVKLAEYGSCGKQSEVLVDKSTPGSRLNAETSNKRPRRLFKN